MERTSKLVKASLQRRSRRSVGIRAVAKPVSKDEYVYGLFVAAPGCKEFKPLETK